MNRDSHPRRLRPLGLLLVLPLAGTIASSLAFSATCDYDCGDMGGRGLFVLLLLCTPPAAAGVLVLAATSERNPTRGLRSVLVRLTSRAAVATVVLCVVVLAGAAIAAGVAGVTELASEPEVHRLGQTEPSEFERDQAREAGLFFLIVASVLAAMAISAALALWAAWKKHRAG
jgi:hypothetical protein